MGRVLLACWLIWGDVRRRPVEAVVFLLALSTASASLTLGLALTGAPGTLYDQTRAATAGPDLVAVPADPGQAGLPALAAVPRVPGVTRHSGPYPLLYTTVRANGLTVNALAEGRGQAPAAVDRPLVTSGSWVRAGGVVLERGFARALGVRVGDHITVAGRVFPVAGIAVTATGEYPDAELTGPDGGPTDNSGLLWLTEKDIRALPSRYPRSYVLYLKLADPAASYAFEDSYTLSHALPVHFATWQSMESGDAGPLQASEPVLDIGGWLLGFLAIVGVAGLAAGRAVQQTRRVGLLKAVGATPGLIAAVLLAEYLILALLAASFGLLAGWLAAPGLSDPAGGLIGTVAPPGGGTIIAVAFLALLAALLTTLAPTLRAVRTSTVRALAAPSRSPHRRGVLTALSLRLPAPLLLGMRLTARRPVRTLLHAAGIAAAATATMALLAFDAQPSQGVKLGGSILADPGNAQGGHLLLAVTAALGLLAAINIIVIAWTTALETRRAQAIARTFGATPGQVTTGLSLGQILSALPATLAGIPAGLGLYYINSAGPMTMPSTWLIFSIAAGIVLAVAALTAVPVLIAARRPAAQVLSSETT